MSFSNSSVTNKTNFINEIGKAIRSTLVLWVLTAILYPLIMIAFAQLAFPYQANGSLLKNAQGQVVGSALIGQPFTSAKYFNSRPSAVSYSTAEPGKGKDGKPLDTGGILGTGTSGGSNLAAGNLALLDGIKKRIKVLEKAGVKSTPDLIYASGSGLDPHITPVGAAAQIARVAKARGLQSNQIEELIKQNTDARFLGIFGEPGVNVLKLNLALDKLSKLPSTE